MAEDTDLLTHVINWYAQRLAAVSQEAAVASANRVQAEQQLADAQAQLAQTGDVAALRRELEDRDDQLRTVELQFKTIDDRVNTLTKRLEAVWEERNQFLTQLTELQRDKEIATDRELEVIEQRASTLTTPTMDSVRTLPIE